MRCVNRSESYFDRIAHELLGQLYKANKAWTADVIPADLMRELVTSIEKGDLTGMMTEARHL